jgi:hypothetical protein
MEISIGDFQNSSMEEILPVVRLRFLNKKAKLVAEFDWIPFYLALLTCLTSSQDQENSSRMMISRMQGIVAMIIWSILICLGSSTSCEKRYLDELPFCAQLCLAV